jgi:two-component system response regulator NreC
MSKQGKLRVLVVDDHAAMREGLCLLIDGQSDMETVGQANEGQEALKKIKECRPDVVVMDISMPKMDGAQATELVKKHYPETKILVLTRHGETGFLHRLLKAGATGYALKSASGAELLGAIRTVAGGGTYLDPSVAEKMVEFYVGKSNVKSPLEQSRLTSRETEIMQMTALGHSNKEIAQNLSISVKTVEAAKARAMEKLDLHSRAAIVQYALLNGWLEN